MSVMKSLRIPDYRLGAYTKTVQASQWAREAAYKYSTNPRSGCGGIEVQHVSYFGQRGIQVQHVLSFGAAEAYGYSAYTSSG